MPKRSKEDTLITVNLILDTATHQLLTMGYDKMSYTTLSQATKISRTGISHHFPKKTDFLLALQGRFLTVIIDQLNLTKGLVELETSWRKALFNQDFVAVLRLTFHHSVVHQGGEAFSGQLMHSVIAVINHRMNTDATKSVERLFGVSLIQIAAR
ncbi:TetR/AcrR family transcriptional regulator [Vibrio sp. D173a]|uniref:TetR/AcrR family transcriptional regulator n=1 Tax=unclassified Vibrio TaxID=2614977 RepID=UPI002552F28B|nr:MULTISPECIES: TetR/AcrR family transcriptional regulator [unclassified Vibrio]MDK9739099.1 TetR/AcrR family transcriptional regulator [Vibrio sp. D404a]MDK9758985.1 TetR/AcrR family transcriptional regulator [Vibrio sp. D173a]MDK9796576.1 TetR/AcrR family transcriptional regulator [Vibrio sp. D449a]